MKEDEYFRRKKLRKNLLRIFIVLFLVSIILLSSFFLYNTFSRHGKPVIRVSGAFALYPLMTVWADKYGQEHGIQIEVSGGGAGKGMTDALSGLVEIGMVSREIRVDEIKKGAFYVAVCKDAVVCTVNSNNPVLGELLARGITREALVKIFITGEYKTWGDVVNSSNSDPISVYTRADACGAGESWAKYLGNYTQDDLSKHAAASINGDPDLAGAICNDRFGIGFNNVNFAYDLKTGRQIEGLTVLPLDTDSDGNLSANESFYETRDNLTSAIAHGLYPSPPARSLYLVTKGNFTGETKKFVRWILGNGSGEGQSFVEPNGYVLLAPEKLEYERHVLETGVRE